MRKGTGITRRTDNRRLPDWTERTPTSTRSRKKPKNSNTTVSSNEPESPPSIKCEELDQVTLKILTHLNARLIKVAKQGKDNLITLEIQKQITMLAGIALYLESTLPPPNKTYLPLQTKMIMDYADHLIKTRQTS